MDSNHHVCLLYKRDRCELKRLNLDEHLKENKWLHEQHTKLGGGGGGGEDIKTHTLTMIKEAELSIYSLIKLLLTTELGCPTVKYHIRKPKGGRGRGRRELGGGVGGGH